MNKQLSSFMNASRWFAAFLVLISHVKGLVFQDFDQVVHKTILVKLLYFSTGLGHAAVVVFFVISGFLVGGLTLERWRASGPDLRHYSTARTSRIYMVLIPALIVGWSLDSIGMNLFNAGELYTNAAKYRIESLQVIQPLALDLQTFVGNVLMLQWIETKHLGSNGPLWSLAYEWWYYCVFALIAAGFTGKGLSRIPLILAGVALSLVLPREILYMGALWVMGLLAKQWVDSKGWKPPIAVGLFLLVAALAGAKSSEALAARFHWEILASGYWWDIAIGFAFVVAIGGAVRMKNELPWPKLQHRLAEFSYTTYLCHFPVLLFLVAVGNQLFGLRFRVQPDVGGILFFGLMIGALYVYCWAFSQATERHTPRLRKWMDQRIVWKPQFARRSKSDLRES